ncbi:siderophore-interacting protein [Paraburkholderia hospita]|uniref:siderophore-interacting protein n=1 Tax=Paraburkholderia hospita TaxID=169430 RepID=UPI0009A6164D|nr:siderophore-interacting protein [Paraburkholderia hospita]SKC74346.1 NADPH-dependent ferric siderophore reductase, contains FAD-binding and SIP domains [Paraburkholderia hospita]
MNDTATTPTKKRAGLLESAMLKLFARSAHVLDMEDIGSAFRLVTLGGEALRNIGWTPGDKIQIQLGGWVQRTYTPIDWDAENGRTRLLIYLHADGPGTQWGRTLRNGDECIVFGPRKSVDLTQVGSSAVVFGDETSVGLAAALLGTVQPADTNLFLEVSSFVETQAAIAKFGLEKSHVSVRADNDAHLAVLGEKMLTVLLAKPTANIVLSGKASSIQHVRKLLKRLGIGSNRFQNKAHWATGKAGLD